MDRNGRVSSAVATGRLGVVGTWLMVLYVVTIATAIMAFSAFQFQTALGSMQGPKGSLTIGELESERQSFVTKQELIRSARETVSTLEADLVRVIKETNDTQKQLNTNQVDLQLIASEVSALEIKYVVAANANTDPPPLGHLQTRISHVITAAEHGPSGKTEERIQDLERLKILLEQSKPILRAWYDLNHKVFFLGKQSEEIETALQTAQEKLASSASPPSRSELIGLFQQIAFFEGVPFGRSFATMPPALLIPIVTLAMGALGSVIYLSVSVVFGEPPRPLAWYLFRPMLGMVTAFAVFILVQAGALVVTQPPAGGGDPGQLNPYFIAFVAIISGLLSEQAVEKIRGVGGSFFGPASSSGSATGSSGAGLTGSGSTTGSEFDRAARRRARARG